MYLLPTILKVMAKGSIPFLLIQVCLALTGLTSVYAQKPSNHWNTIRESSISKRGDQLIKPKKAQTLALNLTAMRQQILLVPRENTSAGTAQSVITLPLPDGTFGRFRVVESPVMAPELARKFPSIKTYSGQGLDDPTATLRMDITPKGFHAMIISGTGTVYIDPYTSNDDRHYISYYKKDFIPAREKVFSESKLSDLGSSPVPNLSGKTLTESDARPSGGSLRTYRIAIATTGEYTAFQGGTVALALSAMVTTLNRVNGIYEREVAIRMTLVANTNTIIYTDAATDPFTNGDTETMLGESQTDIDAKIGNGNYDIGHLFGTNSGGKATLGAVCRAGVKARGVTGSGSPSGDPFDVDYVAHEIGHQFGAQHTFNSEVGSCGGGNINAPTAYEPGSGTTIMGYAGICDSQNIQPNSNDYFHTISFDQIFAYSTSGAGNGCAIITSTGNNPPAVTVGGGGFTIPISTPFTLTGSGTDPDADALTFNWEQFNLGPAGDANSPVGNAPIFRSFPSLSIPSRTFPRIIDIVNNTQTFGELLPTITRDLTFRLTARDNRNGGGGINYAQLSFNVTSTAGPFLVTAPNTALTWSVGSTQTVQWNVANTNTAPVNCPLVNIKLSTDGGFTYPVTILSNVPNDGSQDIVVPNNPGSTARIKIESVGNVFFDISNANFTICTAPLITLQPTDQTTEFGSGATFTVGFSGSPAPAVQWQESTDGGASFVNMPLQTAPTLVLSALRLTDSGKKYKAVLTNICGTSTSAIATLTVTPAATVSLVYVTPNPRQYSDLVTLEATLSPAVILGESPATHVSFYIGTQLMGTVSLAIDGGVLRGTLPDVALLEPTPPGTPPIGQMAPGIRTVTARFSGLNPNFIVEDGTTPLTIQAEDARVTYTGACFVSTPNISTSTATVPLRATVQDITDALPLSDFNPGDIRNATVSFVIINPAPAPPTIIATVPVSLIFPGNTQIGTASYEWLNVSAGATGSQSYTIGFIVNGYYTRNDPADYTIVTVSKPDNDFVSGGGYLNLTKSAGLIAGDVGSKNNYGFNIKYDKKGKNLKGSINTIIRRTEPDGLHVYQIKGNVFSSLAVSSAGTSKKANFEGKANIQDITNPLSPVSVDGNSTLQVKMTDNGEPGDTDMISFSLYKGNGLLWYSSNWTGVSTTEIVIGGGNIVIRGGNILINGSKLRTESPVAAIESGAGTDKLAVYPNPFGQEIQVDMGKYSGGEVTISLTDTQGKVVYRQNRKGSSLDDGVFKLVLPNLNKGMYILQIITGSHRETLKLIHD